MFSMFGRNNSKIEFDARQPPQQIMESPQSFQYVHNFKVHFKRGALQALANKVDVSIDSSSYQMPSIQEVTKAFNERMVMSNTVSNTRQRFSASSFHITNIEYKESMALTYSMSGSMPQAPQQLVTQSASSFCRNCGSPAQADSKFCQKCGTQL